MDINEKHFVGILTEDFQKIAETNLICQKSWLPGAWLIAAWKLLKSPLKPLIKFPQNLAVIVTGWPTKIATCTKKCLSFQPPWWILKNNQNPIPKFNIFWPWPINLTLTYKWACVHCPAKGTSPSTTQISLHSHTVWSVFNRTSLG